MFEKDEEMKQGFFKFPSTPHIAVLPGVDVRGDKVFSELEREAFLEKTLLVEEKIDGANLGISFDSEGNIRVQNRGAYLSLPEEGQWKKLESWLMPRMETLFEHLEDRFLVFGEWCYARHSVFYDRLPDWFLGFDVYDRQFERFLSMERRDRLLKALKIVQVPLLAQGKFSFSEILDLLFQSHFTDSPAEGIYLRFDQDDWLMQRAKLVCPGFMQSMEEHWSRSAMKANRLAFQSWK